MNASTGPLRAASRKHFHRRIPDGTPSTKLLLIIFLVKKMQDQNIFSPLALPHPLAPRGFLKELANGRRASRKIPGLSRARRQNHSLPPS